jgi:hypothetical protein
MPFVLISLVALPVNILGSLPDYGFIFAIFTLLVGLVVDAALILAVGQAVVATEPTPGPNLSAAVNNFGRIFEYSWRMFGTILLLTVTIIGIPWAIRVAVRWSMGLPAIMLHGFDGKGAISESCRLIENNWWRTFGNFLLIGLIIAVPSSIGLGVTFAMSPFAGGVLGAIFSVFTTPFFALTWTLLYLRLRQEKGDTAQTANLAPEPA